MYFELYKDKPLPNRDEFRKNFKKKHGKFIYLEELIKMIEEHQFKKYGMTLPKDDLVWYKNKEERYKESQKSWQRLKSRLGKWKEKHLKIMIVILNSIMKWKIK